MTAIAVQHDRGSYDVLVGAGALGSSELQDLVRGRRLFVVTSAKLRGMHGERLAGALEGAAAQEWIEVPDGEAAKRLSVAEPAWERMLAAGGKRDSLVVGFGGGSVGDLAGFLAAGFLRGVDFVQIPTTLLAQVDASVGGKVGVDLRGGKNTVGAFHQPRLVVADIDVLSTLPRRDLVSGLVESLKKGAVLDLELFDSVERELDALLNAESDALTQVVRQSVAAKARVVEQDPFEAGPRKLLNFGHTLGHAIETVLGYEELRHGEAVAYGIDFALDLSETVGLDAASVERVRRLLGRLELPPLPSLDGDALLTASARDKKARESGLTWVLCSELGQGLLEEGLEAGRVRAAVDAFLERHRAGSGAGSGRSGPVQP